MKAYDMLFSFEELKDGIGVYSNLTVRDHIAIEAMTSIQLLMNEAIKNGFPLWEVEFTDLCFARADAIIAESNKCKHGEIS